MLWDTIHKLYERRIVLDFTDHLSDRELYCLIYRDILPCAEKKIDSLANYLHWDCADMGGDPTIWLRYYASEEERLAGPRTWGDAAAPAEDPPYPAAAAAAAAVEPEGNAPKRLVRRDPSDWLPARQARLEARIRRHLAALTQFARRPYTSGS